MCWFAGPSHCHEEALPLPTYFPSRCLLPRCALRDADAHDAGALLPRCCRHTKISLFEPSPRPGRRRKLFNAGPTYAIYDAVLNCSPVRQHACSSRRRWRSRSPGWSLSPVIVFITCLVIAACRPPLRRLLPPHAAATPFAGSSAIITNNMRAGHRRYAACLNIRPPAVLTRRNACLQFSWSPPAPLQHQQRQISTPPLIWSFGSWFFTSTLFRAVAPFHHSLYVCVATSLCSISRPTSLTPATNILRHTVYYLPATSVIVTGQACLPAAHSVNIPSLIRSTWGCFATFTPRRGVEHTPPIMGSAIARRWRRPWVKSSRHVQCRLSWGDDAVRLSLSSSSCRGSLQHAR